MEFDNIHKEILVCKQNIGSNSWLLGNRLNEVKEKKLYLQGGYGMFGEYLIKGIEMSDRTARTLMRASKEFNQKTLETWGISKCNLLIKFEEPERDEIIKTYKPSEISKRDLEIMAPSSRFKPIDKPRQEINRNDIDYFTIAENYLKGLKRSILKGKDYWDGVNLRDSFKQFVRKKVIEDLVKELKQIINDYL